MYRTLFDLSGIAILAWALVIFLPTFRVTRWIAETAIFPIYLAILYLVGIGTFIAEAGVSFMSDFGSADGVIGLLATEPGALIVWLHILAFDQVVGLLIYRDNMKGRFVPIPVQSLILFATLMFGPIGFLTYVGLRMAKQTGRRVAWGEAELAPTAAPPAKPAVTAPQFRVVVRGENALTAIVGLFGRNRVLVWLSALGFALAGATALRALVNGSWLLGTEGRLIEAVRFDSAIAIYTLTLALVLPLAPLSDRARRRWVSWTVGLLVYSYGIETVQAWRGLDPRFSTIAGPVDQILGGFFFLAALGVLALFIVLMRSFFRPEALPDHPWLRLALRYAATGALIAFGAGIVMSIMFQGRVVAGEGDLMGIHAIGFHGLQAVPLVALLLGSSMLAYGETRRIVHLAGSAWLVICLGLVLQAAAGQPTLSASPALLVMIAGALGWLGALLYAIRVRYAPAPAVA